MVMHQSRKSVLEVLRIRHDYHGSRIFHPGSQIQSQKGAGSANNKITKNFSILTQKLLSWSTKLSEIRSGMFGSWVLYP
jgi:hypothetical protein